MCGKYVGPDYARAVRQPPGSRAIYRRDAAIDEEGHAIAELVGRYHVTTVPSHI